MGMKAAAIAKKPRLRYESSELAMVLPVDSNDEPNKHMDTYVPLNRTTPAA